MRAHRFWTRLFGPPEEINGANRCPTYLYRWIILGGKRKGDVDLNPRPSSLPFKVYLHHFVADDWSLDLHDHPKRFISIGLKGGYTELTPFQPADSEWAALGPVRTTFRAPWIRSFPAEHIHRLEMFGPNHDCWTLVIVLRGTREWGFWHLGEFIHWRKYVKPDTADKMKACGDL